MGRVSSIKVAGLNLPGNLDFKGDGCTAQLIAGRPLANRSNHSLALVATSASEWFGVWRKERTEHDGNPLGFLPCRECYSATLSLMSAINH